MIRGFCDKLLGILRPTPGRNGKSRLVGSVNVLTAGYYDLRRLAEQIRSHADRAPYPHVAVRLRQIAQEKEKAIGALKDKLLSLGAPVGEAATEPKSGKNHWERMVRDLEDQKGLEAFFLEHAARVADEAPEIAAFLNKIVAEQLPHKEILLDLVARADPQAEQS